MVAVASSRRQATRLQGALLVLACLGSLAGGCTAPRPLAETGPRPHPISPPTAADIDGAIRRGTDFLLMHQNRDGSWGSARRTKDLNIYAPVPGAHQAFRQAVTALCVSALIETGDSSPEVQSAIDRAEAYLLANLPTLRRTEPEALYNNWAHAYGIRALVRMAGRGGTGAWPALRQAQGGPSLSKPAGPGAPADPPASSGPTTHPADADRQDRIRSIRSLIAQQIDMLRRCEALNGGWGYLDFEARTQHSTATSTPFMTATVLIAFHEAEQLGVHVPRQLIDRGLASIRLQQNPDFAYLYSENFVFYTGRPICRPAGSLGRSQVCNLALRLWGDTRITDDVLKTWLDRLFARNGWLSRARKFPVPHESWFAVAGYFFYYGHFYAAECIEQLPPADRSHFQDHLARILIDLQEKDGSWWDYPMYDYGQYWGTPYAMLALHRCRQGPPPCPLTVRSLVRQKPKP